MSIERIRHIPSELPPACLYLDDIEEITKILFEAFKSHLERLQRLRNEEQHVTYIVGDDRQDIKATSIEDLRTIGGGSSQFTFSVGTVWGPELRIRGSLPPEINLRLLGDNEARVAYQKIEFIFRNRILALKNALFQMPSWVKSAAWWFSVTVGPFAVFTLIAAVASNTLRTQARVLLASVSSTIILAHVVVGYQVFKPSRVIFLNSFERSKERLEKRRSQLRDVGFALLGFVLSLVGQIIIKLWFH